MTILMHDLSEKNKNFHVKMKVNIKNSSGVDN